MNPNPATPTNPAPTPRDAIVNALSFAVCTIKSGEQWSAYCDSMFIEAHKHYANVITELTAALRAARSAPTGKEDKS